MESKYINRYHTYCKCLENPEKSKNADPNADFVLEGTIMNYNLTFDIAWKVMKDILVKQLEREMYFMKKKIILTIAFVISLLPMLLNQYGGMKGVQEISGLINLYNPIGIISVLFFIIGIWIPFKNKKINKIFGGLGVVGIVISEIYIFFTWHIMNITGKMSIHNSIEFAFPAFYVGLVISLIMIAVYFCIDKIVKE